MDEKKIYQQKLLARILNVCAGIILFTSFLSNRMSSSTVFGLVFLAVGLITLRRVKKAEEKLKN